MRPCEEPSGDGKQTYSPVKVHPPSMGQSVTLHIVPPVLARCLSFSLSHSFLPLTSPSCLLLHGLQGLFLFSSVRSKQVGEALSVPSSSPHHGGPAGNVPRSLLRAFAKVFTAYFLLYVAFLCSSSSICDSARVCLTISPLYVRHLAA